MPVIEKGVMPIVDCTWTPGALSVMRPSISKYSAVPVVSALIFVCRRSLTTGTLLVHVRVRVVPVTGIQTHS